MMTQKIAAMSEVDLMSVKIKETAGKRKVLLARISAIVSKKKFAMV